MRELRLTWQLQLKSPHKLFCACPHTSFSARGRHNLVRELLDGGTNAPQQGALGWQRHSPTPSTNQLLRLHASPSSTCAVDRGTALPETLCPDAFAKGNALALALSCQRPRAYIVIRHPRPKRLHLSGYTRSILLGRAGHLPAYKGPCRVASLFLEESPCQPLPGPTPAASPLPTYNLLPGGDPILSLTSTWHPWSARDALGEWLAPAHEALLTSGWFRSAGFSGSPALAGILRLEHRSAGKTLWVEGAQPHDHYDWPGAIHQLEVALEAQSETLVHGGPAHTPYWRWQERSHKPALWGWRPAPPYAREPELAPAPPTPLAPPVLQWRWREQWQMRGLSPDVIDGLLAEGRVPLLDKMVQLSPKCPPQVWGELLVRWPRALQRRGCPTNALADERFMAIAALHGMGKCHREGLRDLLAFAAYFPDRSVRDILRNQMGIAPITADALRKQLPTLLAGPLPRATKWPARERFWMGRLMQQLQGALPGHIVREELYRAFSKAPPTPHDQCRFPPPSRRRKRRT